MINYLLLLILFVLIFYFLKSKFLNNFINKEIKKIQNVNYSDHEIEFLVNKNVHQTTVELISKIKNNISEKEKIAIQKILNSRQTPQGSDLGSLL